MSSTASGSEFKKILAYARLIALGVILYILLKQQLNFYTLIAPASKNITKGSDFISQKEQSFTAARKILPAKGVYRFKSDCDSTGSEFEMHYLIARYSLAPRVLVDSFSTDTMVCAFYKTRSINNPQNPLFASRKQWTILDSNESGIMVLKKNK